MGFFPSMATAAAHGAGAEAVMLGYSIRPDMDCFARANADPQHSRKKIPLLLYF